MQYNVSACARSGFRREFRRDVIRNVAIESWEDCRVSALDEFAREAQELSAFAQKMGDRNHGAHYFVGLAAVLAGVTAAGLGFGEADRIITGIGGVIAAVLAGVQTLFTFEAKARYHYAKVADYSGVRRWCTRLNDGYEPPSQAELRQIADRLTEIQSRPFQGTAEATPPTGA
jgi:hypothetical protein